MPPIRAVTILFMNERIEITTLTDGGQQPPDVARRVAGFLDEAKTSLDLAQYDFNLGDETRRIVGDAFMRAAGRGVNVRFAFNVDHANPIPVPPPSEPDAKLIATLPVDGKAIAGVPDLMHHKYVIRDHESVWTGSLNWTDDSWSRQENVISVVHSAAIAKAFDLDFEQLWSTGDVAKSGFVDPRWDDGLDLADVDTHLLDEIEHFFEFYKTIEPGKDTSTRGWEGASQAEHAIESAKSAYHA